jgi:hypothetical protein
LLSYGSSILPKREKMVVQVISPAGDGFESPPHHVLSVAFLALHFLFFLARKNVSAPDATEAIAPATAACVPASLDLFLRIS